MNKYIDADRLKAEIEKRRKHRIDANEKIAKGKIYSDTEDDFNRMLARYGNTLIYQELFELICFIDSLQQEQPESICLRCVYRNKMDDICEYPYGGRNCRINENGVYECNGFQEVEQQEQPKVELDFQVFVKEMDAVFNLPKEVTENTEENPLNWEYAIARHFYELGLNARNK